MKIVLCGTAGSGKDTIADYLTKKYKFKKYAFSTAIREMAMSYFPLQYDRNRREVLQNLGTAIRLVDENYWITTLFNRIFLDNHKNVIITDCRVEREYKICQEKGYLTIKVECDNMIRNQRLYERDSRYMTTEELNHVTEQLDVHCDYTIDNNSDLKNLYKQLDYLMDIQKI